MLNYHRITALPVGIILNFKHPRLEWERLMLTNEPELDGDKRIDLVVPHSIRVHSW